MKKLADIHVHIDSLSIDAVKGMFDFLKELGVTDLTILALCKHGIFQNLASLYWKNKYKDINISSFGSLHQNDIYSDIPYEKQVETLLDMGMDGMKFLEMKPDFRKTLTEGVNSKKYDKMFSLLEERNIPTLFHVNDPEEFWDLQKIPKNHLERGWFYGDGTYLSKQEIYDEVFKMLDKHPKLNVVFAHFFFMSNNIDEATRIMEKYPNVRFDLTPGTEMFKGFSKNIDAWHNFFEKYSNRILYGTDSNVAKIPRILDEISRTVKMVLSNEKTWFNMPMWPRFEVKGLNLSDETVEKICYKNYHDFVGTPNKADMNKVLEYANKMICDLKNDEKYVDAVKYLESIMNK
ncbi:MAG: hypothetical protein E7391_04760 [Ruminococcaceae bacterium]|nr:hypothetical protein [Oscillospiraceae bacterium]